MQNTIKYSTSEGDLTVDELMHMPRLPKFTVMAGKSEWVHPAKRQTVQMDYPKSHKFMNDLTWQSLQFSNGEILCIPDTMVLHSSRAYSGATAIHLDTLVAQTVSRKIIFHPSVESPPTLTHIEYLGEKDWEWLSLKFVDPHAYYMVNSMFHMALHD